MDILQMFGARVSQSETLLFNVKRGGYIIIIIIYADDILFTGNNSGEIHMFIKQLDDKLGIRIQPEDTKVLGVSVDPDRMGHTIHLQN